MSETGRKILGASLAVMLAHVIFKAAGFIQARVIGHYCDPVTRDLFYFALQSVVWTFFLIGEEGLGPAFLPVFMGEMDKRGESAAWRFASSLFTVQTLLIALVVTAVMCRPETVVRLFSDWDNPKAVAVYMERAPDFVRWMIPALFALSIGSTTYLVLNGYKRFFLAAFGDAAVKFLIIAAVLLGIWQGGALQPWLILGVVAGSLAKLFTHLLGMRREAGRFRPSLALRTPAWGRFSLLVLPLLVGILFAKVRDLYNDTWILTHTGEAGLFSANAYGKKIFNGVGQLVPYSVSIAMFPFFCELVDRERRKELAELVLRGSSIVWVFLVPVTAVVVALSLPLSRLLFQTGRFDLLACRQAAVANACYTLVLPFFALEYLFMQAFFSNRKMVTPVLVGILFSSLSMGLSWLGVVRLGLRGSAAVATVGLAYTVSRTLKTVSLGLLMRRFLPDLDAGKAARFALRMLLAGCAAGGAAYGARWAYESRIDVYAGRGEGSVIGLVLPCLAISALTGGAAYLGALRILCPAEWRETLRWTRARLAGRGRFKKDAP
ncbi:MAG: lipid II flippase MurJ [Planctomycetota bacterium]